MLERLTPGLRASVEARAGSGGHKWLVASIGETTVRVTMAGSPSCEEHALNNLRQQCWRALRQRGVAV
jgi:hypothetical protein